MGDSNDSCGSALDLAVTLMTFESKYLPQKSNIFIRQRHPVLIQTQPLITIQSPANYNIHYFNIWFNVTLNEEGNWCAYSLDGAANITMTNTLEIGMQEYDNS